MDDVRRLFMSGYQISDAAGIASIYGTTDNHQIFNEAGRIRIVVVSALLWKQNVLCKIRQMSYNRARK